MSRDTIHLTSGARIVEASAKRSETLKRVQRLARLLDSQFRIPGTNWRFGLDGIIGLIPGAGDVVTTAFSGYLVFEAARLGVGGATIARMVLNLVIDFVLGSIPLLGDIFDIAFKANIRNLRLLEKALATP